MAPLLVYGKEFAALPPDSGNCGQRRAMIMVVFLHSEAGNARSRKKDVPYLLESGWPELPLGMN